MPKNPKALLEIGGIFAAVRCAVCGTISAADSDTYVAFYGRVAVGLDDVLVDVEPPKKPAKQSMVSVCRDAGCLGAIFQQMVTGGAGGDEREWAKALKLWTVEAKPAPAERAKSATKKQLKRA